MDVAFDRTACCDHADVLISLIHRLRKRLGSRLLNVVEVGVNAGILAERIMKAFPFGLNLKTFISLVSFLLFSVFFFD